MKPWGSVLVPIQFIYRLIILASYALLTLCAYCLAVLSLGSQDSGLNIKGDKNLEGKIVKSDENSDQCELCSGKDDICAHEVLRDGEPDSASCPTSNKMARKVCHTFMRIYSPDFKK